MKRLFILLLISFGFESNAADNYLCEGEAAGGVKYNFQTKTFEGMGFSNKEKNILQLNKNTKKWELKKFGDKIARSFGGCEDSKYELITCKVIAGEFAFSKTTLRYYETYTLPSLAEISRMDKETKELFSHNTPMIEVGKCAEIN